MSNESTPTRHAATRWTFATRSFAAILIVCAIAIPATCCASGPDSSPAYDGLRAGAAAVNVTPLKFPVIVNGMFEERTTDRAVDQLFARAFVLGDDQTRIAIVVVDNCMMPRELLDEAKARAAKITGIPVERMLISATHTHSAPSVMGTLGSRSDPEYPALLIPQIVRAIQLANDRLQPARIGWTSIRAPKHTFCRRYIRRSDRILIDPFGKPTARANMHPGFLSEDAIGPSGPVDDELSLMALQTADGKPLGVLANYSMHYIGSPMLSSDYFGRFAEYLGKRIDGGDGTGSCIVSMSQGTSGDLASMNYSARQIQREYDSYASELAQLAHGAYQRIEYRSTAPLTMSESKLALKRRVPDAERLAWAKSIAETIGDRRPKGRPEVYALEQLELAAEPERELKLQAMRIGDLAITAIPNEVFAITGLKLKRQSPLPATFNIELANGADGYIPPPEQHALGGYTTWAARTAGLEVDAEPKIVEALLKLLEDATGKPRRVLGDAGGSYAAAVRQSKPRGYWRLQEIAGTTAADSSGGHQDASYEIAIAHYLPGPVGQGFADGGEPSTAAHFAGGRVRAKVPNIGESYSVEFWFWNGLPNDVRPVTGYLCSRGADQDSQARGDHLGISGTDVVSGRLFFFNGNERHQILEGRATIEPRSWNHVVLTRDGEQVRVYLNGRTEPEIAGIVAIDAVTPNSEWFFGGRNDGFSGLEGKLSEAAIYDRALTPEEARAHYKAAGFAPSIAP